LTKYKSVKGLTKKNNDCVKKVKRISSFCSSFWERNESDFYFNYSGELAKIWSEPRTGGELKRPFCITFQEYVCTLQSSPKKHLFLNKRRKKYYKLYLEIILVEYELTNATSCIKLDLKNCVFGQLLKNTVLPMISHY